MFCVYPYRMLIVFRFNYVSYTFLEAIRPFLDTVTYDNDVLGGCFDRVCKL